MKELDILRVLKLLEPGQRGIVYYHNKNLTNDQIGKRVGYRPASVNNKKREISFAFGGAGIDYPSDEIIDVLGKCFTGPSKFDFIEGSEAKLTPAPPPAPDPAEWLRDATETPTPNRRNRIIIGIITILFILLLGFVILQIAWPSPEDIGEGVEGVVSGETREPSVEEVAQATEAAEPQPAVDNEATVAARVALTVAALPSATPIPPPTEPPTVDPTAAALALQEDVGLTVTAIIAQTPTVTNTPNPTDTPTVMPSPTPTREYYLAEEIVEITPGVTMFLQEDFGSRNYVFCYAPNPGQNLIFRISNQSDKQFLLRFDASGFKVVDNLGREYPVQKSGIGGCDEKPGLKSQTVNSGDTTFIEIGFFGELDLDVVYLLITVENVSGEGPWVFRKEI